MSQIKVLSYKFITTMNESRIIVKTYTLRRFTQDLSNATVGCGCTIKKSFMPKVAPEEIKLRILNLEKLYL